MFPKCSQKKTKNLHNKKFGTISRNFRLFSRIRLKIGIMSNLERFWLRIWSSKSSLRISPPLWEILNEILIWIKKRFFFSFSIMINHEKQVLKNVREILKFSDNRPEPPGLDLTRTEKRCSLKKMQSEKDAFWKRCSRKRMQFRIKNANAFKPFKRAARSKRIIFLDHAPFYGNYEKKQTKKVVSSFVLVSLNLLHLSLNILNPFCLINNLFKFNLFCFI